MNIYKAAATLARLFLTVTLLAVPLNAQRRRPSTPKPQPPSQPTQPAPTFESVLAADTYRVYGEVRGVGQLLRSSGVNDILAPLVKLASPPKEFKTLVKWLDSQADTLMSSRLMIAALPSRPNVPQVLLVIEFDSTEEAQKFAPLLRGFVPKLLPTPTPAPTSSPESSKEGQKADSAEGKPPQGDSPPPPRFEVKQAGPLVFLSETTVSLKALKPAGSKPLMEDNNFRQAHSRFSSESIFLYVDVAAFEKEDRERRRVWEEEERKRIESEAANPQKAEQEVVLPGEVSVAVVPPNPQPPAIKEPQLPDGQDVEPAHTTQTTLRTTTTITQVERTELSTEPSTGPGMVFSPSMFSIMGGALFGGPPQWPEAIGVAVNFEGDSYVVRALLINDPEVKASIIPFMPQLVSGPPVTPEASSILPADTELLITASLDYPQIYDGLMKNMMRQYEEFGRSAKVPVKEALPESPFAAYEAKLGIKIKDDLLPLLGNEIAVSVPLKSLGLGLSQPPPTTSPSTEQASEDQAKTSESQSTVAASPEPQPIIAISVRDKETLRTLIPKIIDTLGFKGASMLAQTEKRGDTELVSYAGALSYAFIGNFLVASPDVKSVRRVVDSYLNHQTLASDPRFRDATRWQPRAVLGQVYMPTELMEAYYGLLNNPLSNKGLHDFVSQLSPTTAPVTYSVSNEGLGPLHELHLPKNLVMFMIAGMVTESNQPPPMESNEVIAKAALRMLASAETTFQADKGKGSFGSMEQLAEQGLIYKDFFEKHGYKIELIVSGTKFEATAVPLEYGKTGMMSFFIDESGVLRGGDRGGAPASLADKPVQ